MTQFDKYPGPFDTVEEEQRYLNYINMLGPCSECKRTPKVGGFCHKPDVNYDTIKMKIQKMCMNNDFRFRSEK